MIIKRDMLFWLKITEAPKQNNNNNKIHFKNCAILHHQPVVLREEGGNSLTDVNILTCYAIYMWKSCDVTISNPPPLRFQPIG